MSEVYRATDTNVKRAVAINVLPASVAANAERLARLQREAEASPRSPSEYRGGLRPGTVERHGRAGDGTARNNLTRR
jgi:hypothetical protein